MRDVLKAGRSGAAGKRVWSGVNLEHLQYVAVLFVIFLLAGSVKGAVGLGLPTTALALMTLMLDPRTAISLVLIPILFSNFWQMYRSGDTMRAFRTYLPLGLSLMVMVAVTIVLTANASERFLLAMLGATMLVFVAVSIFDRVPPIPEGRDRQAQIVAGGVAGILGGLTSVWAPPMAIYLMSRRTPKAEFVRATGLLFFLGSIPLVAGYISQGYMTGRGFLISLSLVVPTFLGFSIGEHLRGRLSERAFRYFVLLVFAVMGLNLIRKAVLA